jgi:phytoene dehydrogenase-like protein
VAGVAVGRADYDAIIVGSGPNGLAAAITLAQEGWKTLVIEASETIGGGMRSGERTLPGFLHDICSAVHPLANASLFFRQLDLEKHGLRWMHSPVEMAHPLDGGEAVLAARDIEATAQTLGEDRAAYQKLMAPFTREYQLILDELHGPFPLLPRRPFSMARFGLVGLQSAQGLSQRAFRTAEAQALFAGFGGHSILPLERAGTGAAAIILGMTLHAVGWPLARGGSQTIADALLAILTSLGGEIQTGWEVKTLHELPKVPAVLLDITPKSLVSMAGDQLPDRYRQQLLNFTYGAGTQAITVHVGGSMEEIVLSEAAPERGEHAERPFVLLSQPTLFDSSRAPEGKHIAWAYCHVPNCSTVDMTERIEAQIERFAPGFRERVLARHTTNSLELEKYNPNYVGGDISAGRQDIIQQFARPVASLQPYRTPLKGVYLCSSSTPPGGGVHGMCGYRAARLALRDNP